MMALEVLKGERHYAVAGLITGCLVILVGCALFYLGVDGKVTWSAKAFGFSSELVDASPGAVLFIVGLFIIWGTRYKVSLR